MVAEPRNLERSTETQVSDTATIKLAPTPASVVCCPDSAASKMPSAVRVIVKRSTWVSQEQATAEQEVLSTMLHGV